MALSSDEVDGWAAALVAARRARCCRAPITSEVQLELVDAYAIQDAVTASRLRDGERLVGWKLGYTSAAMRAQMGIAQPNLGPLTDAMLLGSGDAVSAALIQPRVEPEIGLRLRRPLAGEVGIEEVLDAVGEAFACLEVVDSVYHDYRFRLEDNTADGSSAAQVVVGPPLAGWDRLDEVGVVFRRNGVQVGSATGSAASGHPALGCVWLVRELATRGRRLEAGDIVVTGGLTAAVPLEPGDRCDATFDDGVVVAVHRLSEAGETLA